MDVVTIVVEGESAVYVLNELHPVLLAPDDNLLALLIIFARLHLGFLGMQEISRATKRTKLPPNKLTVYVFCSSLY